jgi:photosystem II stability/assembly factor-like uncharacterized protein
MTIRAFLLLVIPAALWGQAVTLATGTTASLRGLSVADGTIWASGQRGTVIRSTDGGTSWTVIAISGAESADVRSIHARSATVAHAASTNGRIWSTGDAGKSWSLRYQASDTVVFLDAINFIDDRRGMVLGDPIGGRFFVLVTADGGETWQEATAESRPAAVSGEAAFAASGSSLAIIGARNAWIGTGGAATRVFRSGTAGRSWTATAVPLATGTGSKGVFSLAFADSLHGVALGGDYQQPDSTNGTAAVTSDGGRTWQPSRTSPRGFRSGAALARVGGRMVAIATGTNGTDVSYDGGVTWMPLDSSGFNAVQFTADGIAVAVGGNGRAARFDLRAARPRD